MTDFSTAVIVSTYNHPEWLQKTLWGYLAQSSLPSEIIIADDGSKEDTAKLIEHFQSEAPFPVIHVWHPDDGFRKCEILNKAIVASRSDYLIFTDQDCVPRGDFVAQHRKYAEGGYFLSGGYFKLPMDISLQLTKEDIFSGRAFHLSWLKEQGLPTSFKATKLWENAFYSYLLNKITPTKASWNGMNSSCWKADALKVNGFNTQLGYGGEDREFGERLSNSGIRSKQLRYSLITIHLDHKRPYKDPQRIAANKEVRRLVKQHKTIVTPNGIRGFKA